MAGWHHWCSGHELGQTSGDDEGQGAWCTAAQEVAKSWTQLGGWTTATVSTGMENIYGGAMWVEGKFSFELDM